MAIVFDLSSIPQGFAIEKAEVKIYKYSHYQNYTNKATYNIYRITKAWDESSANWTKASSSSNWSKPGGDYNSKIIDSYEWDGNSNGWFDFTVTGDVKEMVSTPASDFGFLISLPDLNPGVSNESHNNECHFRSSEADNETQKPRLVIKGSGNVSVILQQKVPALFRHAVNKNVLSLYFTGKKSGLYMVTITDISGKTLLRKEFYQPETGINIPLHFSAGLYCVSVSGKGIQQVKNFLLY